MQNTASLAQPTNNHPKVYLEVPYSEKDAAKKLGAKWDPDNKKWFISNIDITPFKGWIPQAKLEDENMRANNFYLAQTYCNCYKCNMSTLVNAIILPEGFGEIDHDAMDDLAEEGLILEGKIFCEHDYCALVSYVTYISPEALDEIYKYTTSHFFYKKHSRAAGNSYYRSICQHCNAAQGDNFGIAQQV